MLRLLFLFLTAFVCFLFFFSSRRRHTRFDCDWSSDVCSSDLVRIVGRLDVEPEPKLVCVVEAARDLFDLGRCIQAVNREQGSHGLLNPDAAAATPRAT